MMYIFSPAVFILMDMWKYSVCDPPLSSRVLYLIFLYWQNDQPTIDARH